MQLGGLTSQDALWQRDSTDDSGHDVMKSHDERY